MPIGTASERVLLTFCRFSFLPSLLSVPLWRFFSIALLLAPPFSAQAGEHVQITGQKKYKLPDPAEQVSGVTADYLNKRASFGPLGSLELQKAPFSVMQTNHDVVENQQLRTADQMVGFMPSVQIQPKGDNPVFTGIINRGFTADKFANSRINGLNASFSTPIAAEQVESLSVLNGIAGALYGPESPAGVVDVTLKRPTQSPFFNFNFGYDSNGSPLESVDTSLGKGPVKIRFNYLNQTGQMYVKGSNQWRNSYSGDIDIQLAKHTKIELDASQYNMSFSGLPGIFTYGNTIKLPSAPSASLAGYGQQQGGVNASTALGVMRLKHDFSRTLHLTLGGLYQSSPSYNHSIVNQFLNNQGDYRQSVSAIPIGREFSLWSNSAYLNATLKTGFLQHHLDFGTNGFRAVMDSPLSAQSYVIGESNITAPEITPGPEPKFSGSYHQSTTQQQSLLFGDTIALNRYISLMGQFSWGWISLENYNKQRILVSSSHENGGFSPSVGAVFEPFKNFTGYFNWGKSIGAGSQASAGSQNAGEILPIYQSEQYEGGIKYLYKDRLQFSLDGFTMTRPYAFTDPASLLYAYNGIQRDSGIEFQTSGALNSEISILGGVTWLHPFLEHSSTPNLNGKEIAGVPQWASNFLLDYHPKILKGIAFNANIHYVGARAANINNTDWVNPYVTLDMGTRYKTKICGHELVFRFEVNNITEEKYWASLSPSASPGSRASNSAALGLPRTWHLTTSLYF